MPIQIKGELLLHPRILFHLPDLPLAMICHDPSCAQVYRMFQKSFGLKNYLLKVPFEDKIGSKGGKTLLNVMSFTE